VLVLSMPHLARSALLMAAVAALSVLAISAGSLLSIETPRAEPNAHESDHFWDALHIHAGEVEHYASWQTIVPTADIVVVGTIEAASYGRRRGSDSDGWAHYANLTVYSYEVLAGAERVPPGGIQVEMLLPSRTALMTIERSEPSERVVLFLRDKHAEAKRLGLPPDQVALEEGYFRLVQQEAVVREIDGKVRLRSPDTGVYGDWAGQAFEEFIDAVRQQLVSVSSR
jgi:hypothetical protein